VIASKTNPLSLVGAGLILIFITSRTAAVAAMLIHGNSLFAHSRHTHRNKKRQPWTKKALYCWVMMPGTARWETGQENSSSCRNAFNITIFNNIRVHSPVQRELRHKLHKREARESEILETMCCYYLLCACSGATAPLSLSVQSVEIERERGVEMNTRRLLSEVRVNGGQLGKIALRTFGHWNCIMAANKLAFSSLSVHCGASEIYCSFQSCNRLLAIA
jgi:hypothetical protein